MGIFSTKYRTTIATAVARVIQDDALPHSLQTGAVRSIFNGDGQMVENSMEELINGLAIKANRMYNFAKNDYHFGLPSDSLLNATSGRAKVELAVEAALGFAVTVDYYKIGAFNNLHYGWKMITENHGYNSLTNTLSSPFISSGGRPVYLTNIIVVVADATFGEMTNGSLDQWGVSPTAGASPLRTAQNNTIGQMQNHDKFLVDNTVFSDYLRIQYAYTDVSDNIIEGFFDITVAAVDDSALYHQMKYIRPDGKAGYFSYIDGSGTYPDIDAVNEPTYAEGTYFPFTYIINEGNFIKGNVFSPEIQEDTKRMFDYIHMDLETLSDTVLGQVGSENVKQGVMMYAVPANTENQIEMQYLHDYFKQMFLRTGGTIKPLNKYNSIWQYVDISEQDGLILIQDKSFKMSLGYRNIFVVKTAGVIGSPGTYTTGRGHETQIVTGTDKQTGAPYEWPTLVSYHFYRKQINEAFYEEVRITNLRMVYHIEGDYRETANDDENILLIPIDRSVSNNYSLPEKEELYARSLHLVFNSYLRSEVDMLERGYFKWFMVIVAVIITVISQGTTWELMLAALAAGTITVGALIWALVIGIIKQLVVQAAVKFFVKKLGLATTMLLIFIAAAYGILPGFGGVNGAPFAQQMLQMATGIVQENIQDKFEDLQADADMFKIRVDEATKEIKDAEKLLENSIRVNPFIIFGEKPNEYYDRTIHSGNIGPVTIDAISSYVDVALTLPTLNETVGENFYAV